MYLEEINTKISKLEDKISKLRKEIRQQEDDYEDMSQAKDGLVRVEDTFQSKKKKHQTVFNDGFFQKNRCMQRLSASMINHLAGNTSSVSSGISDVENRMSDLKKEIDSNEQKLDRYLNQLSDYRWQARSAVSKYAAEG